MDVCSDLHSISLSSKSASYSFPDWDLQNIGIINSDISQYMENTTPFYEDDLSTGYLQDVIFKFRSKRRRLFMFDGGGESLPAVDPPQDCWTRNVVDKYCQDLGTISHGISAAANPKLSAELKQDEETNSETYAYSSSSPHKELPADNNQWNNVKENLYSIDHLLSSGKRGKEPHYSPSSLDFSHVTVAESKENMKKKKVVYPFAVVKPWGFEGAATLNDINRRILMPPTRQLRHPVGDFAIRPLVSPEGPGLSGKSVVSFTRIQTQGRGTITIIRTRD